MIKILGHNLIGKKKVSIALTAIYGIGMPRSLSILQKLGIPSDTFLSELGFEDFSKLRDVLENGAYQLEGNLKRIVKSDINRLIAIKSYRGRRHLKRLPVRGQRTRTNAKTAKLRSKLKIGNK